MRRPPPRSTLVPDTTLFRSDISRWKRVIGDGLRSRTDGRQATEVAIAADVLNRMFDLGRPEYVRIADRKSTRLNSSHANISYAVFCLQTNKYPSSADILITT